MFAAWIEQIAWIPHHQTRIGKELSLSTYHEIMQVKDDDEKMQKKVYVKLWLIFSRHAFHASMWAYLSCPCLVEGASAQERTRKSVHLEKDTDPWKVGQYSYIYSSPCLSLPPISAPQTQTSAVIRIRSRCRSRAPPRRSPSPTRVWTLPPSRNCKQKIIWSLEE